MAFGGGSPGLAILAGVAQGLNDVDKRKREKQQEAILARLREQQIRESEQNVKLQQEREGRYRAQFEAEQQALEEARVLQAEQRQEQANLLRQKTQQMAEEIARQRPDWTPEQVHTAAWNHVNEVYEYEPPEVVEPEKPNAAMLNRQDRVNAEQRYREIVSDPTDLEALTSANSLQEAYEYGTERGLDPIVVEEVWRDLSGVRTGSQLKQKTDRGEEFGIDDLPENLQEEASNQAMAMAQSFQQEAAAAGGEDDETASIALDLFNKHMRQVREAQEHGFNVTDIEMAMANEIKRILLGEIRAEKRKDRKGKT